MTTVSAMDDISLNAKQIIASLSSFIKRRVDDKYDIVGRYLKAMMLCMIVVCEIVSRPDIKDGDGAFKVLSLVLSVRDCLYTSMRRRRRYLKLHKLLDLPSDDFFSLIGMWAGELAEACGFSYKYMVNLAREDVYVRRCNGQGTPQMIHLSSLTLRRSVLLGYQYSEWKQFLLGYYRVEIVNEIPPIEEEDEEGDDEEPPKRKKVRFSFEVV